MARTKQDSWKSVKGKAPKQQLAAKAVLISEHGFKMREVREICAESRDRFCGRVYGKGMTDFEIFGVELHPAIRGFFKLLGRDIFVPLEDLAILVDGDGSPFGGYGNCGGPIRERGEGKRSDLRADARRVPSYFVRIEPVVSIRGGAAHARLEPGIGLDISR
jgi:hypothetical protein